MKKWLLLVLCVLLVGCGTPKNENLYKTYTNFDEVKAYMNNHSDYILYLGDSSNNLSIELDKAFHQLNQIGDHTMIKLDMKDLDKKKIQSYFKVNYIPVLIQYKNKKYLNKFEYLNSQFSKLSGPDKTKVRNQYNTALQNYLMDIKITTSINQ